MTFPSGHSSWVVKFSISLQRNKENPLDSVVTVIFASADDSGISYGIFQPNLSHQIISKISLLQKRNCGHLITDERILKISNEIHFVRTSFLNFSIPYWLKFRNNLTSLNILRILTQNKSF